ncbi:hypothetical protein K432DRAFT_422500 [Lepidopterella palustris CBS 459.81]|uniref:Uncharacterized protein n=1 Tax=Lepidopterella palustris CBS 459.81 TaxID=1314670 RepID=A0A8E2EIP3_9PEZI|nr:hypothetical protein K432DRAFT_422500 [Lepidopterella palustris CBS 459.81]
MADTTGNNDFNWKARPSESQTQAYTESGEAVRHSDVQPNPQPTPDWPSGTKAKSTATSTESHHYHSSSTPSALNQHSYYLNKESPYSPTNSDYYTNYQYGQAGESQHHGGGPVGSLHAASVGAAAATRNHTGGQQRQGYTQEALQQESENVKPGTWYWSDEKRKHYYYSYDAQGQRNIQWQ